MEYRVIHHDARGKHSQWYFRVYNRIDYMAFLFEVLEFHSDISLTIT